MESISGGSFTKQQFLQTNNKLHGGVESPTKNIRSSTEHRGNQADTQGHDGNEKVLVGEYRKSPVFAVYHTFAPAGYIERYMESATFRFHETKKDDPIMAVTISIFIHLKMEMEEFVA